MSSTASIGAFICSFVLTVSFFQERGWRGIVPLHSTREDVERLFGPPMTPGGITYDLKTDRVNVVYSAGGCREAGAQWNVPRGMVIGITIYPQTKLLADLKIDLNRFEKFINPHAGSRAASLSTLDHARARVRRKRTRNVPRTNWSRYVASRPRESLPLDGGRGDRLEVELYALPSWMSPPRPNPYRHK